MMSPAIEKKRQERSKPASTMLPREFVNLTRPPTDAEDLLIQPNAMPSNVLIRVYNLVLEKITIDEVKLCLNGPTSRVGFFATVECGGVLRQTLTEPWNWTESTPAHRAELAFPSTFDMDEIQREKEAEEQFLQQMAAANSANTTTNAMQGSYRSSSMLGGSMLGAGRPHEDNDDDDFGAKVVSRTSEAQVGSISFSKPPNGEEKGNGTFLPLVDPFATPISAQEETTDESAAAIPTFAVDLSEIAEQARAAESAETFANCTLLSSTAVRPVIAQQQSSTVRNSSVQDSVSLPPGQGPTSFPPQPLNLASFGSFVGGARGGGSEIPTPTSGGKFPPAPRFPAYHHRPAAAVSGDWWRKAFHVRVTVWLVEPGHSPLPLGRTAIDASSLVEPLLLTAQQAALEHDPETSASILASLPMETITLNSKMPLRGISGSKARMSLSLSCMLMDISGEEEEGDNSTEVAGGDQLQLRRSLTRTSTAMASMANMSLKRSSFVNAGGSGAQLASSPSKRTSRLTSWVAQDTADVRRSSGSGGVGTRATDEFAADEMDDDNNVVQIARGGLASPRRSFVGSAAGSLMKKRNTSAVGLSSEVPLISLEKPTSGDAFGPSSPMRHTSISQPQLSPRSRQRQEEMVAQVVGFTVDAFKEAMVPIEARMDALDRRIRKLTTDTSGLLLKLRT